MESRRLCVRKYASFGMIRRKSKSTELSLFLTILGICLGVYFWANPRETSPVREQIHTREIIERPVYIELEDKNTSSFVEGSNRDVPQDEVQLENNSLDNDAVPNQKLNLKNTFVDPFSVSPLKETASSSPESKQPIDFSEAPVPNNR